MVEQAMTRGGRFIRSTLTTSLCPSVLIAAAVSPGKLASLLASALPLTST
jgi:hypothetical protein